MKDSIDLTICDKHYTIDNSIDALIVLINLKTIFPIDTKIYIRPIDGENKYHISASSIYKDRNFGVIESIPVGYNKYCIKRDGAEVWYTM